MTYYPQKPTDWSSNLSKVYERQSRQLEEHHANLRQRDKEEEEVAKKESFKKTLEGLAEFVPKAMEVYNKVRGMNASKGQTAWDNKSRDEKNIEIVGMRTHRVEIEKRDDAIRQEFAKLGYNKEDIEKHFESVKQLLPGTIYKNSVYAAKDTAQYLTKDFMLDAKEGDVSWNTAYKAADAKQQEYFHRDFISGYLEPLQMSPGHWGDTVSDEIDRMVSVTSGTKKTQTKALKLSSRASEFKTQLVPLTQIGSDASHGIGLIKSTILDRAVGLSPTDDKTSIQLATESVVKDLYDMGQTGDLTRDMLNKLVTGEIDHPAGKTLPDAFFDKDGEMEAHLLRAVTEGEGVKYKQKQAIDTAEFQSKYLEFSKDNSDTKGINEYIQKLSVSTLDGKDAKIELLEDIRDNDQSPAAANQVIKEYASVRNDGNLDTKIEEIKEVKNVAAKNLLLKEAEQLKDAKDQTGFAKQEKANEDLVNKIRTEKTFGQGKPTVLAGWVTKDLNRFQSQDFAKRVRDAYTVSKGQPIDLDKISIDSYQATQAYWQSNGGGLTQRESSGKFAVDENSGDYQNYGKYLDILSRTDNEHNVPINLKKWLHGNNEERQKYQTNGVYNPELRYQTPNALLSHDDISGILQNGYLNSKQLTLAEAEGFKSNPSALLEHAINSLKKSKDPKDKAFVELMNLNSVTEQYNPKDNPDTILKGKLDEAFSNVNTDSVTETTFALNMKNKLKYKGIGDFSQNDYKQLFLFLNQSGYSEAAYEQLITQIGEIQFEQEAAEFGKTEAGIAMNELGNK